MSPVPVHTPADPHSFTDSQHPLTSHVSLCLYVDFPTHTIQGSALLTLQRPHSGDLVLDTRGLIIVSVSATDSGPFPFTIDKVSEDPIKGTPLKIFLPPETSQFLVIFSTSPKASALQWLNPAQTWGKKYPYVYTQCQSIHCRSIFPCQDTPSARICYDVLLNIPEQMRAVMSAGYLGRNVPQRGENRGACDDEKWVCTGRSVESFKMEQPIPPYLFAFAVGELDFVEVGPRTRIYSEPSDVLQSAAQEFKDVEDILRQGEKLFGDYIWERFDLLVLPPSFPYGGMENPRIVFLTPAIITGEGTGAQVLAHELAHSWTGNLITNSSNNDFWLNEGFTTYAERRIVEVVQGKEKAALNIGLGCASWKEDVERFKENVEFTKLRTDQEGINPDDVYSCIPYEKGFQFLWRIERQVGRAAFDEFLKKYIETFKFQSIDTDTFLGFLERNLPGIEKEVDLEIWVDSPGLPPDMMDPISPLYEKILSASSRFALDGSIPAADDIQSWQGQEWNLFLENLPRKLPSSQIKTLYQHFKFSTSTNWDVKVAFLIIAAYSGYEPLLKDIETCLKTVGRMMYLRPLYRGLLQSNYKDGKQIANRIFEDAKNLYHPIAQGVVESLFTKSKVDARGI